VAHLSGLFTYPIKSCGDVPVTSARVEARGLSGDRRYMLVEADGSFVTQREDPVLIRVRVSGAGGSLRVAAAGLEPLDLGAPPSRGACVAVRVWGDETEGVPHPEGSEWFSALVGRAVRLIYMPDEVRRPVDPRYAEPEDVVGFADGFPLLVLGEGSLDELARRAGEAFDVRRFRPNLVLAGLPPHAEDEWQRFRIGSLRFRAVKPCSRCVIPTRDPDTGEAGKEPLATLATYRKRDGKVFFGMNVIPDGEGELRVGERDERTGGALRKRPLTLPPRGAGCGRVRSHAGRATRASRGRAARRGQPRWSRLAGREARRRAPRVRWLPA
jgi:uncharacterized protein YcbX